MRKVIFVGGTAYSGSTFLGMTLGNDPKGFACGEVGFFFNPTQAYHVNPRCGCGDDGCRIWERIKDKGQQNLYETIFDMFPDVEHIVDSSKSPLWIRSQKERLLKRGIQTKSILIWKTPLEIAHSFQKRGHLQAWEKSWVNYHRLFYTSIDEWRAVKYRDYTDDKTILEKLCEYLGIPYYPGKEYFWEKAHHVLLGNHTARIHLLSASSEGYRQAKSKVFKENSDEVEDTHRTIYYQHITDDSLQRIIEQRIGNSKYISEIMELLNSYDISNEIVIQHAGAKLSMSRPSVWARKVRQAIVLRAGRLRYARDG